MKIIENTNENQEDIKYIKEYAGTERTNRTRVRQINQLINTWKERHLFGWEYYYFVF